MKNGKLLVTVLWIISLIAVAMGVALFLSNQLAVIVVDDGAKVRTHAFMFKTSLDAVPSGTIVTVYNQSRFEVIVGVPQEMTILVDGVFDFPWWTSSGWEKVWVHVPAGKTLSFSLKKETPEPQPPCLPAPVGEPV